MFNHLIKTKFAEITSLLILPLAVACGDGSQIAGGTGFVEGYVDSTPGATAPGFLPQQAAEARSVAVGRLDAEGSFEALSVKEAELQADGRFRAEVLADAQGVDDLVVHVKEGSEIVGKAIVGARLAAESTVKSPPVDSETTLEADVYSQIRNDANWDSSAGGTGSLRMMLTAEMADKVHAESDYEGAVNVLANASAAAMNARTNTYGKASVGVDASVLADVYAEIDDAQATLDSKLDEAASAESRAQARAQFDSEVASAHADASITVGQRATSEQAASDAFLVYVSQLGTQAEASARSEVEAQRSLRVRTAVEAQIDSAELSASARSRIEDAGDQLTTQIAAAADAGAEAGADVEAAWEAYFDVVVVEMEASVSGGAAIAVDTVITATNQALSALAASLDLASSVSVSASASASADAVVKAYADITGETNVSTLTTAGVAEARAKAMLTAMAHAGVAAK